MPALTRLTRRPTARLVSRLTLSVLVANVVLVVTGGAVRLTSSGLGCPTFPTCTRDSLVTTPQMGGHGVIEFGNRMLTWVLTAITVAALVAIMRQRPRRSDLAGLIWLLLGGIFAQALLGGVAVLTGLNPVTVMAHFILSAALIGIATVLHVRSGEPAGPVRPVVHRQVLLTGRLLVAATAAILVLGTVVTGSGPHSGDKYALHRLPISPASATQLHADVVFLMLGLTVALLVLLPVTGAPARVRARAYHLVGVTVLQGVIGYVQYFTKLPAPLVAVHMLMATLVWIASVRLLLAMRERVAPLPEPAAGAAGVPAQQRADA